MSGLFAFITFIVLTAMYFMACIVVFSELKRRNKGLAIIIQIALFAVSTSGYVSCVKSLVNEVLK